MTKRELTVRMSPTAGWVTCDGAVSNWTHIIDRHGVAWSRGEEMPLSVYQSGRYVRPKLPGEQLELLGE